MYLTPQQLRQAADIQERILSLQAQVSELLQIPALASPPEAAPKPLQAKKRRLSPQGLANIRAGVAKRRSKQVRTPDSPTPRRELSPAGRARLSALAKARWKKVKAQGKSTL